MIIQVVSQESASDSDLVSPNLADLQEMSVGISEEAADLATAVDGRCQEFGTARSQHVVGCLTVGDAHGQLMTDAVGVRWRSESHGWLALGWTAAGNEEEPFALELQYS